MPTTIFMVMNRQAYDELSPKNRAALDKLTGLDISLRSAAGLARFGQIALSKFRGLEGKQIVELAPEARAAFDKRAAAAVVGVLKEHDAKGIPASEVVAAMKK